MRFRFWPAPAAAIDYLHNYDYRPVWTLAAAAAALGFHRLGERDAADAGRAAETDAERRLERMTAALRSAKAGCWEIDAAGRSVRWDAATFALHGLPQRKGATLELWQTCLHPLDRKAGLDAMLAALHGDAPFDMDLRVVWPNGESRYIRTTGAAVRDAVGCITGVAAMSWDITDQVARCRPLDEPVTVLQIDELLDIFDDDGAAVVRLLEAALDSIRTDTGRLLPALGARDASAVIEIAHRIKGTSGSIHAVRLRELSAAIENDAKVHEPKFSAEPLAALQAAIQSLAAAIRLESSALLTRNYRSN